MTKYAKKSVSSALGIMAAVAGAGTLSGCSEADVASSNLSKAADNFQVERQINFIDTITGQNIVTIRGLCSLGNNDKAGELSVTCKVGENQYIKDFFGLSSSVAYSSVQVGPAGVNSAHYNIVWNPGVLVPTFREAGGNPLTPTTASVVEAPKPDQPSEAPKPNPGAVIPTLR